LPRRLTAGTPFLGANNATKTFPSIRGMVSTWPLSPISAQQAGHFGATDFLMSHFAAAMKNHGANFVAFSQKANDLVLANRDNRVPLLRDETLLLSVASHDCLALFMRFLVAWYRYLP